MYFDISKIHLGETVHMLFSETKQLTAAIYLWTSLLFNAAPLVLYLLQEEIMSGSAVSSDKMGSRRRFDSSGGRTVVPEPAK